MEELGYGRGKISIALSSDMEDRERAGDGEDPPHLIWSGVVNALGNATCRVAAQTVIAQDERQILSPRMSGSTKIILPIFVEEGRLVCEASVILKDMRSLNVEGKIFSVVRGPFVPKAACEYKFPFFSLLDLEKIKQEEWTAVQEALK